MKTYLLPLFLSTFLLLGVLCAFAGPVTFYVKGGAGEGALFGFGARSQVGSHGWDFSLNPLAASLMAANGKVHYFYYPRPHSRGQAYFGFGGGVNQSGETEEAPRHLDVSGEGVAGYQFRRRGRVRPFIQLELSKPLYHFDRNRRSSQGFRGTVQFGIGF